jgi:hypothetical protein
MKFTMHEILSRPSSLYNEDSAFITDSSAWILDGASGLADRTFTHSPSDGQWFVHQWNEYLQEAITDDSRDLRDIVIEGIDTVKDNYFRTITESNVDPISYPSSAVVIVRIKDNILEYFILGDCTLVVESNNTSCKSIVDNRIDAFDSLAVKEIHNLQKTKRMAFDEARARTLPLLRKHRSYKNKKNGYWILEFDKNAVAHAIYSQEALYGETYLLLMSDGFAQLSTTFKKTENVAGLLNRAKKDGLNRLYQEIQEMAKIDKECMRFPRLKPLDDASAILLRIA